MSTAPLPLLSCLAGLTLLGGVAHAEHADPAEMERKLWQDIGLRFDLVEELVDPARCYEGERDFMGCVVALEALLEVADPPQMLVPHHPLTATLSVEATPTKQFGLAFVVPGRLRDLPDAALEDLVRAWRDLRERANAPFLRLPFDEIAAWIRKERVDAASESQLTSMAINGYLAAAEDPFHRIVPTRLHQAAWRSTGVSSTGIGIMVERREVGVLVLRVFPRSPAAGAGLQVGDVLVAVDGQPLDGLEAAAIAALVSGPEGTEVHVSYRRGRRVRVARMVRAEVEVPHVFEALVASGRERVGYVRAPTFMSDHICEQVEAALERHTAQRARAMVLDLRGNSGGLVEQCVCVADLFLPAERPVAGLRELGASADTRSYKTERTAASEVPLIVLIDGDTGSAAELLAGALQDHNRAIVIGRRSFGKGTIQDAFEWSPELEVSIYRTIGHYTLPRGESPHLVGVVPDLPFASDGNEGRAMDRKLLEALWLPAEATRLAAAQSAERRARIDALDKCVGARSARWSALGDARFQRIGTDLAIALDAALCLSRGR